MTASSAFQPCRIVAIQLSERDPIFAKFKVSAPGLVEYLDTARLCCNSLRQQDFQEMSRTTSPLYAEQTDRILLEIHNFRMKANDRLNNSDGILRNPRSRSWLQRQKVIGATNLALLGICNGMSKLHHHILNVCTISLWCLHFRFDRTFGQPLFETMWRIAYRTLTFLVLKDEGWDQVKKDLEAWGSGFFDGALHLDEYYARQVDATQPYTKVVVMSELCNIVWQLDTFVRSASRLDDLAPAEGSSLARNPSNASAQSSRSHASDRTLVNPISRTNTVTSHANTERVRAVTGSTYYQSQPRSPLPVCGHRQSGSGESGTSTATLIADDLANEASSSGTEKSRATKPGQGSIQLQVLSPPTQQLVEIASEFTLAHEAAALCYANVSLGNIQLLSGK